MPLHTPPRPFFPLFAEIVDAIKKGKCSHWVLSKGFQWLRFHSVSALLGVGTAGDTAAAEAYITMTSQDHAARRMQAESTGFECFSSEAGLGSQLQHSLWIALRTCFPGSHTLQVVLEEKGLWSPDFTQRLALL